MNTTTPYELTALLQEQTTYNPAAQRIIRYSKPHDVCDGREIHLGNMAGGFPFKALGRDWKSVEFLYLCGEWSLEDPEHLAIQQDILSAPSGYAAKRYKKAKHRRQIRADFPEFRHQWMLWCIWQKCLGSAEFRSHLLSMPDDAVIVEVVPRDPVWAAQEDEATGLLTGGNAVGKILTICRDCLREGISPAIDGEALNNAGIHILGNRIIV